MNWCILIPLLVGLISGLLGYLIGRSGRSNNSNADESLAWKRKNDELSAALDECKRSKVNTSNNFASNVAAPVTSAAPIATLPFDGVSAKLAFGKNINQDDLKVVEGIGPKIAEMFHVGGIKTWKELSEAPVSKCQEILDGGGSRYQMHKPGSWPKQAKMAYEGKWAELKKWQDDHKGGIE